MKKYTSTIITAIFFLLPFFSFSQDSLSNNEYRQAILKIARQFSINLYKKTDWVNDHENLFSKKEINKLDSLIDTFEKETTIEIVIVTIDSSSVAKENFDNFTLQIANKWAIGKVDKSNGILIGISSEHKRIRIQNGYGIEKLISNEETRIIIKDHFIPYFKKNKYYSGVLNGTTELMKLLRTRL